MRLKIERNKFAPQTSTSRSKLSIISPRNTQSIKIFNYLNWRNSQQNTSNMGKSMKSINGNKNTNSLRTLLGDMSKFKKYARYVDYEQNTKQINQSGEKWSRQMLIKSMDYEDPSLHTCKIIVDFGSHEKVWYHKAKTVQNLLSFLSQKHSKVLAWKVFPENIAMDYYLTLKNKDISFLNNQTLTLNPYKTQKQQTITLQSFTILKCIGTGGFSKVFLCRFKEDGKFYAMKVIDKQFIVKNKKKRIVMNQKNIMEHLKHPFILEMKFSFQSMNNLIFVLELCPGGELFGLVKKFRVMNEEIAKFYMIEILLGLEQIHKNGIVYRDFKPENILIDIEGHVRIADFGLAKPGVSSVKEKAYSFCGSPQYMPPEMISKKGHSLPVDFYCLGALLYELVTGLPPFYSQNSQQIYEGTMTKQLKFPNHVRLSQQLQQLLKSLLNKDEIRRLGSYNGVKQVFAHPWFSKINRDNYVQKIIQAPVKFTGIKDLKMIFMEVEVKNKDYLRDILDQQQIQFNKTFSFVMQNFYYDFRQSNHQRTSFKSLNDKQNRISSLTLRKHLNKTANSKQRVLRNIMSQRTLTHNISVRKKQPLSNRATQFNIHYKY